MKIVYKKNKSTNEIISQYDNVLVWGANFVEYIKREVRAKIYCNPETEYFTDEEVEQ